MNRLQKGFTLIEILVVVAILGVLMGLVTVLVSKSSQKKRDFATEQIVGSQLPMLIERYKSEFKKLPPMSQSELASITRFKGLSVQNSVNECIEVLLVALRHPDLSSPLGDGDLAGDKPFGNTDEDIWNKVPDGSPDENAWEILDGYGNPVVYIHKNRYDQPVRVFNNKGDEVDVSAVQKPNGTFYNPDSYQLISLGENGVQDDPAEPDFMDDVMNFKILQE